jgi:SpoVK/Ycf46/Vps4 family AAA+-type ATPase
VVELSAMVDKYIGETEKNLQRLFDEADRVDAVLLFDEADSIFGKRSETKDAHDRYANLESSYLLQRLESFDGVAVLTTNLRSNIDDAFTRRFDLIVDFPFPDEALRRTLWEQCLSGPVPVAHDVELERVAGPFELAGGSIRAAATTAAYLAAAEGRAVSMEDLLTGARREYRKMGRLIDAF